MMPKTDRDVAGSSILYLLFGFPTEGRKAACVAEGCLAGEEGDTIVDCVDVVFVRAVPEA
jgi:hypothetical protein